MKNKEEQELQKSVVFDGESPNCRSSREYREFQKEWIKGSCEEFRYDENLKTTKCKRCTKPYLRHHEARYVVQHGGLL